MSRNHSIVYAAAVLLVLTLLLYFGGGMFGMSVVLGIPFLLVIPGYSAMLFVDPESRTGGFEWFALTVALSISITATVGIALGMSVGITQRGVIETVAAASALLLFAASMRSGSDAARRPQPMRRTPVRRAMWATVALLACTGITLWLSLPHEDTARSANVVQLWAIRDVAEGGLRIGVTNVDAANTSYRLTITQSGRSISDTPLRVAAGATEVVYVNRSELASGTAPVSAVVRDTSASATVSPRKVSVWMPQ
jgi:hypothetical protein